MSLLVNQEIVGAITRSYTIQVPDSPSTDVVPAIIVFHGGGGDAKVVAKRWGVDPPNPVPAALADYLLVFPESDPRMGTEWVHFGSDDSGFPTLDLDFVERLVAELTTPLTIPTTSATVPFVSADDSLLFAAGFSNGGGMVWQLLNSPLETRFQGFAAVGKALDPEKAQHYRAALASSGAVPAPAPVVYIQGTADTGYRPPFTLQEAPLDMTLPVFTLTEMLDRNAIPRSAPATTRLVPGSTGVTEVVLQLFEGGNEAFLFGTVINGGHNWPTATTHGNPPVAEHFDATEAIVDFWRSYAGLP
jgi:polyhydroxybutyrate depolymerase